MCLATHFQNLPIGLLVRVLWRGRPGAGGSGDASSSMSGCCLVFIRLSVHPCPVQRCEHSGKLTSTVKPPLASSAPKLLSACCTKIGCYPKFTKDWTKFHRP